MEWPGADGLGPLDAACFSSGWSRWRIPQPASVGRGWLGGRGGRWHSLGQCRAVEADSPPWAGEVWAAELVCSAEPVAPAPYRPLPLHPAVARDLALLLAADRRAGEVADFIRQRGERAGLESVEPVDEFRGAGLPTGKRSVAFRLVFRASDRTLTDAEVDQAVQRLVRMLERELDVTLRTA
ncbi:MAG: hypothetical protein H6692_03790 [Gemmatimonadales bacterium]|nr:hypothetical protein [Gemmatimonadales bacterium]